MDRERCVVGARFSLLQRRATVRYVGEIPSTTGVWLGVEWDDGQGKHSGDKDGAQYFHCRADWNLLSVAAKESVSGAGSFIRNNPKISWGVSFLHALSSKYLPSGDVSVSKVSPSASYSRRNLADIDLEAPNLEGVASRLASRLGKMREVGLGGWKPEPDPENPSMESYAEVAYAFDDENRESVGRIAAVCPSIRWLDLSRSLLPSWTELSRITKELPKLETLVVHFNRFAPSASKPPMPDSMVNVAELLVDGTLIDWPEVEILAFSLPSLRVLQMGHNDLSSLNSYGQFEASSRLQNLKVLNLEGNKLGSWGNIVHALGNLPRLERLNLSQNALSSIPRPEASTRSAFPSLEHISLRSNLISKWEDLDALDSWLTIGRSAAALAGLRSLAIGAGSEDCAITAGLEARDARPLILARLKSLQNLDGAEIRPIDRRDAELFYISFVGRLGLPPEERKRQHPRFEELRMTYDMVAPESAPPKAAHNLRSKLIDVQIHVLHEEPSVDVIAEHLRYDKVSRTLAKVLRTSPLRLALPKLSRAAGLQDAKAVTGVWVALKADGVEGEVVASKPTREGSQIIFSIENLGSDLASYDVNSGDALILVVT